MIPSSNLIDTIKKSEGFIPQAYTDVAGIWTIGYGSTRYKNGDKPKSGQTITEAEATELLLWEVGLKAAAVNGFLVGISLGQNKFDALVDFAYNLGVGALAGSTLLRLVKRNPTDPAIRNAFMVWNKAKVNGKLVEVRGLTIRRAAEANLYFK